MSAQRMCFHRNRSASEYATWKCCHREVVVLLWALSLLFPIDVHGSPQDVVCVPWQGSPTARHTAIPGREALLKAVVHADSTDSLTYTWDFGDGTAQATGALAGQTLYRVEALHTYQGETGTAYSATLTVTNPDGTAAIADLYPIILACAELGAEVNIAVDEGLWFLYRSQYADGHWASYSSFHSSATASAVHAFVNNKHFETASPTEDPYGDAVRRGMRYIFQTGTRPRAIAGHAGDADGNGYAVEPVEGNPAYQLGMIMDAIVSSGTPNASCGRDFDGDGVHDTYREVVQDMCDAYSWGQYDDPGYGGWRYSWNQAPDNSACQWAAIGMIPAQRWGCIVPEWVKERNYNWLAYSYQETACGGTHFGYTSPTRCGSGTSRATRPSGLVQLVFDDKDRSDPYWLAAESWFHNVANWRGFVSSGDYYAYFAFMKAMRLMHEVDALGCPAAADACGVTDEPSDFLGNCFNWYRGSGGETGLARELVSRQYSTGAARGSWPAYYGQVYSTAWSILTLTTTGSGFVPCPFELYHDENHNGIKDPTEGDALTCLETEVTFYLDMENPGERPDVFTLEVLGVPSGWVSLPDPAGESCLGQPLSEGEVCLLAGENRRVPIQIRPSSPGAYTVRVQIQGQQTSFSCPPLDSQLLVSDSTLVSQAAPDDGIAFCSPSVEVSWSTCGVTTGAVHYRPLGDPPSGWIVEPVETLEAAHRIRLDDLAVGAAYEWYVSAIDPADPDTVVTTTPREFSVQDCVTFARDEWSFEIPRDYDNVRSLAIENRGDSAREVLLSLENPADDLFADFAGLGSRDEPVLLPPGETVTVRLGLHSQDAAHREYVLGAVLRTTDGPPLVDRARIRITIDEPVVDFVLENTGERQEGTLANRLRVTNVADPLTDLQARAPAIDEQVSFLPTIDHVRLQTGGELEFEVVPSLIPDPADPDVALPLEGQVRASAVNDTVVRLAGLDFSAPVGETLFLARVDSPSLCGSGAGWYCTNRPRIAIPIRLPEGFSPPFVRAATLRVNFTPSPRWSHRPHDLYIYVNGEAGRNLVGSFQGEIPRGTYDFSVPAELVHASATDPVVNTIYIHSNHNGGHYVVTARASLCICLESYERFLYAPDQDTANARLSRLSGLTPALTDLSVVIERPTDGAVLGLGEAVPIVTRVVSGETPAPGLPVLARVTTADAVVPLFDDGRHLDGEAGDGLYGNSWVPRTPNETYTVEVTAATCAASGTASVTVGTPENPCDRLVECMNQHFDFYGAVPAPDSLACPEACRDEIKVAAAELDDDDLWVTYLYPTEVVLFDGPDLHCGVDANLWYEGPDPTGRVPLDLEFDLGPFIPGAEIRTVLAETLGGGMRLDGAIAGSLPRCEPGDPEFLSRLAASVWAAGLPVDLEAAGGMKLRYDPDACFVVEVDRQLDLGVSAGLEGASFERSADFYGSGATLTVRLVPTIGGKAGLLVPTDGGLLPTAFALATTARLAPEVEASLDLAPELVNLFFDRAPTVTADIDGEAFALAEVALAREDLPAGEELRSPFYFDEEFRHRVVYEELGAYEPVLFVRIVLELEAQLTVVFDPRGSLFPEQERSWSVPLRLELARHWGQANVTVGSPVTLDLVRANGEVVESVPELGKLLVAAPLDGGAMQAVVTGTGAGVYGLTAAWPARFRVEDPDNQGGPPATVIRRTSFRVANVQIAGDQVDVWNIDPTAWDRRIQDLVEEGQSLDDAIATTLREIDNDQDGIPDSQDPRQDPERSVPLLGLAPVEAHAGASAPLVASLRHAGSAVGGRQVDFFVDGAPVGSALAGASGEASLEYLVPPDTSPGSHRLKAVFPGDAEYLGVQALQTLEIRNEPPVVTLTSPALDTYPDTGISVEGEIADHNLSSVRVYDNGVEACDGLPCSITGPGWHRVRVLATDANGLQGEAEALFRVLDYPTSFVRGDTNCDGIRDISDAIMILEYAFLGRPRALCCAEAANVELNDQIDLTDAVNLLEWEFLGTVVMPAPAGECGVGSEKHLDCDTYPPCQGE